MTAKKLVIRIVLLLLVAWLLTIAWGFIYAWRPLDQYRPVHQAVPNQPILTADQYRLGHPNPYLVQATDSKTHGAVLIFGATHVKDPGHPSLARIRTEFDEFEPTVVLCEGRMTGLLFPGLMDPVQTFGESGLVRHLAYERGCRVYTWEPPEDVVVHGLLDQGFEGPQVALRIILSSYFSNLRFGKPDDPAAVVQESIRKKKSWPVIGDVFVDIQQIDSAWQQYFDDGPDWRDVSDETELPGFLGQMDSNLVRDQHLFNIVAELVGQGERVFVIAGSSHAVKLENAIRSSFQSDLDSKQN